MFLLIELFQMVCSNYNLNKRLSRFFLIVPIVILYFLTQVDTVWSANRIKIVVLGDSLTAGYGLKKTDAFPVKLEIALGNKGYFVKVINAGVSGDTTAGGKTRLAWALSDKPQVVILELGANDGLRGLDPRETRANLDTILKKLKERGVLVLLAGMLAPPNLGKEYVEEFNQIYPDLAKKHGISLYNFFLEGVANDPSLNQADGIHPNPSGVNEIVDRILPTVTSLIDTIKKN